MIKKRSGTSNGAKRPVWRRRLFTVAMLLALCAVAAVWDQRAKRAPHPGFCPKDAQWAATAANLPEFWNQFVRLDGPRDMGEQIPALLDEAARTFRTQFGMKPAAASWRFWLGPSCVAAQRNGRWGVCVRPGLALRCKLAWSRAAQPSQPFPRLGRMYYAWREGFLILSPDSTYVQGALDAPETGYAAPRASNAIKFYYRGQEKAKKADAPTAECTLWATPGLYVEGKARTAMPFADAASLALPDSWNNPPMIVLAGASARAVREALSPPLEWLRAKMPMQALFPALDQGMPVFWQYLESVSSGETAAMLADIDLAQSFPVPVFGAVTLRRTGEIFDINRAGGNPGFPAIPYAWGEHAGWRLPVAGETVAINVAEDGPYWTAVSREAWMQDLLDTHGAAPVEAALALRIDWERLGPALAETATRLARFELVPRQNEDDVRHRWSLPLGALGQLGRAAVDVHAWGGWMQFSGYLAQRPEPEP